jgi:hypothetical protein
MSITETLGIVTAGISLSLVVLSVASSFFRNEDLKSAFLHSLDSTANLTERAKAYRRVLEFVLVDTMPFGKYNKKMLLIIERQ